MPNVFREQLDYYIAPRDKFGLYTGFYVPDEVWKDYVVARSEYFNHVTCAHFKQMT